MIPLRNEAVALLATAFHFLPVKLSLTREISKVTGTHFRPQTFEINVSTFTYILYFYVQFLYFYLCSFYYYLFLAIALSREILTSTKKKKRWKIANNLSGDRPVLRIFMKFRDFAVGVEFFAMQRRENNSRLRMTTVVVVVVAASPLHHPVGILFFLPRSRYRTRREAYSIMARANDSWKLI